MNRNFSFFNILDREETGRGQDRRGRQRTSGTCTVLVVECRRRPLSFFLLPLFKLYSRGGLGLVERDLDLEVEVEGSCLAEYCGSVPVLFSPRLPHTFDIKSDIGRPKIANTFLKASLMAPTPLPRLPFHLKVPFLVFFAR